MIGRQRRVIAFSLLCAAAAAHAEQFVESDGFRVHYAALPTTDITPQTARAFGITRGRNRALLVLNAQAVSGADTTSVAAQAEGTARSLLGHTQNLALRAAREGAVHYVIAEFEVLNQEWMVFDVRVHPEGAAEPLVVRFKQQFYTE